MNTISKFLFKSVMLCLQLAHVCITDVNICVTAQFVIIVLKFNNVF